MNSGYVYAVLTAPGCLKIGGSERGWKVRVANAYSYSVLGETGLVGVWKVDDWKAAEDALHAVARKLGDQPNGRTEMFVVSVNAIVAAARSLLGAPFVKGPSWIESAAVDMDAVDAFIKKCYWATAMIGEKRTWNRRTAMKKAAALRQEFHRLRQCRSGIAIEKFRKVEHEYDAAITVLRNHYRRAVSARDEFLARQTEGFFDNLVSAVRWAEEGACEYCDSPVEVLTALSNRLNWLVRFYGKWAVVDAITVLDSAPWEREMRIRAALRRVNVTKKSLYYSKRRAA